MKRILFALLFVMAAAYATNINTCQTLSSAGTTYDLTASVTTTGTCFTISADNIILNCHGYTVDGDDSGTTDYAVTGTNRLGLIVKNCVITDFATAININNWNNSVISNHTISSQNQASVAVIRIRTGSNNDTIANNSLSSNTADTNIYSDGTTSNFNLFNNTCTNLSQECIEITDTAKNYTIYQNTITGQTGATNAIKYTGQNGGNISANYISGTSTASAIYENGWNQNNFYNNIIVGNFASGIELHADFHTVYYNNISNSTGDGISAVSGSVGNHIKYNIINNVSSGINATNNFWQDIQYNQIKNSANGILINTAYGNDIFHNNMTNISGSGIRLQDVDTSSLNDNKIINASTGVYLDVDSDNNTFNGLYIYNNSGTGIKINTATTTGNVFSNLQLLNLTTYINESSGNPQDFYNTTLSYNSTVGWANWTYFNLTSTSVTNGITVYIQPDFISINESALPGMNSSAAIRLATGAACVNKSIFKKTGLPATAADIIDNGIPTGQNASCTSGIADFNVTSWSGYALSSPPATLITLISPVDGATLSGTGAILTYNLTTYDSVECNTTVDGTVINSQTFTTSQQVNVTGNLSTGSHLWYVRCYFTGNPAYYKTSANWQFNMGFSTYQYEITLNPTPQNVLNSPQTLYYDVNGNMNLLYFIDQSPTDQLYIHKVAGGAITQNYTQPFNATKSFFAVFRENGDTWMLAFNTDNATRHFLNVSGSTLSIANASTTYNVRANDFYDPYAYANTKNIPTITNQTGSHYLFILPTTSDSRLIHMNYSIQTFQDLNTTNHNRKVVWQTIAENSNLTSWFYPWLSNSSCSPTTDQIQIWKYNGTAQAVNATPDTNCYNQTEVEKSLAYFAQYGNKTYALLANLTGNTTFFLIEENKTAHLSSTMSEPSEMLFIDQYTFIVFSHEGTDTFAYSCYFGGAAGNCTRMASGDYGDDVPYTFGLMTTGKRNGTSDVVATGKVQNTDALKFFYSERTYDTKFICYDEMEEFRKAFTVQVFTQNSSQILKNSSWGYVLPSDALGGGRKRAYFECTNGTLRLFLVGLNNNFRLNSYSLDQTDGEYYVFKVTDQFNQPVSNITITAQRFSNLNQAYATIEQGVSDVTGSATLFLEPFALYQVTIDASDYVPLTFEFVPSGTTSVTIVLGTINGTVVSLPTFERVFNDVSFSLTPKNVSFSQPNLTMAYQVVSSNATLEYYGMEVVKKYNGTTSVVYSQNITGQPSGGLLQYTATDSGQYEVVAWFKAQNYAEYHPLTRMYYVGNATGLAYARSLLEGDGLISGWSYYLIAVIVSMVGAIFVSRYSFEGGGAVGLVILWGFTLLNPGATIYCLVGASGCITPVIATTITTVMVLAGLYVTKNI